MKTTLSKSFFKGTTLLSAYLIAVGVGFGGCRPHSRSLISHPKNASLTNQVESQIKETVYKVTIDATQAQLDREFIEPREGFATVEGADKDLNLKIFVHKDQRKEIEHPGQLWVTLKFENQSEMSFKNTEVEITEITGSDGFYDFSDTPFVSTLSPSKLFLGGIDAQGFGKVILGMAPTGTQIQFKVTLKAMSHSGISVSSSPIISADTTQEIWAAGFDTQMVSVFHSQTLERTAQILTSGYPSSLALFAQSSKMAVTSPRENKIRIIDTTSKQIIQEIDTSQSPLWAGKEIRHLVSQADSPYLYSASYVDDTVAQWEWNEDAQKLELKQTLKVGRRPGVMSLSPDGQSLFVSHFLPIGPMNDNHGLVTVLDTVAWKTTKEALLSDDSNENEGAKCILADLGLDTKDAAGQLGESVPSQLYGVYLHPNGNEAWSGGLRFSGLPIWEGDRMKGGMGPNVVVATGMNFIYNTKKPEETREMPLHAVWEHDSATKEFLDCFKPRLEFKMPSALAPRNGLYRTGNAAIVSSHLGLSDASPVGHIGFSKGGKFTYLLARYSDELIVYNSFSKHPQSQKHFLLPGSTPIGLALTQDGKRGFVSYENEAFLTALDFSSYQAESSTTPEFVPFKYDGQMTSINSKKALFRDAKNVPERPLLSHIQDLPLVDQDPLTPEQRLGAKLFSTSSPEKFPGIVASRKGACVTCHPGGGHDGSVWATMEGERRTMNLYGGVAGRGWLHQSATHLDAAEFVSVVVAERLGGKNTPPEQLQALTSYVATGIPHLQGPTVNPVLVQKGKALFDQACEGCHSRSSAYSSGNADLNTHWKGGAAEGPILFNLGTATPRAGSVLGGNMVDLLMSPEVAKRVKLTWGDRDLGEGDPLQLEMNFRQRPNRKAGELKAQSLVGAWDYNLFFHDGRKTSLAEALDDMLSRIGMTESLTEDDKWALMEYLKTL